MFDPYRDEVWGARIYDECLFEALTLTVPGRAELGRPTTHARWVRRCIGPTSCAC
jgi:hypothetical protein